MSDPFHHARVTHTGTLGYHMPRYRGDDLVERVLGGDRLLLLIALGSLAGIALCARARRRKPRFQTLHRVGEYRLPCLP